MVGRSAVFMLMNVYNRESTSIVTCSARERYNMVASFFDTEMFETIANKLMVEINNLPKGHTIKISRGQYDDVLSRSLFS